MTRDEAANLIAVAGAGAWGTALANVMARKDQQILLFARDPEQVARMRHSRRNEKYLPGVSLHTNIVPTASLHDLTAARIVLAAVPAQNLRSLAEALSLVIHPGVPVVSCAKGIERDTGFITTDVIAECLVNNPAAVLSGPSFAQEVARGKPTAVTLAARDDVLAGEIAQVLSSPVFRLYHTSDVRGVEIGGATKNVLAIAAGIVAGRGLGESARAAVITRGFAELARFGKAYGARSETLMGLSGLGDLVLTCNSPQSRNFSLGLAIGRGETAPAQLAEGAFTAPILVEMAKAKGVDMPIAESVDALLQQRDRRDRRDPALLDVVIDSLLARPLKAET
jgi:glycerol-3-phosphate dehydrogenase (NAD(P)+)